MIAGGGTAGHVEPGLAVAQELRKALGANTVIEFLGTKGGVETDLVPRAGYTLHTIKKAVMPRTLNLRAVGFPFTFYEASVKLVGWFVAQTWSSALADMCAPQRI